MARPRQLPAARLIASTIVVELLVLRQARGRAGLVERLDLARVRRRGQAHDRDAGARLEHGRASPARRRARAAGSPSARRRARTAARLRRRLAAVADRGDDLDVGAQPEQQLERSRKTLLSSTRRIRIGRPMAAASLLGREQQRIVRLPALAGSRPRSPGGAAAIRSSRRVERRLVLADEQRQQLARPSSSRSTTAPATSSKLGPPAIGCAVREAEPVALADRDPVRARRRARRSSPRRSSTASTARASPPRSRRRSAGRRRRPSRRGPPGIESVGDDLDRPVGMRGRMLGGEDRRWSCSAGRSPRRRRATARRRRGPRSTGSSSARPRRSRAGRRLARGSRRGGGCRRPRRPRRCRSSRVGRRVGDRRRASRSSRSSVCSVHVGDLDAVDRADGACRSRALRRDRRCARAP